LLVDIYDCADDHYDKVDSHANSPYHGSFLCFLLSLFEIHLWIVEVVNTLGVLHLLGYCDHLPLLGAMCLLCLFELYRQSVKEVRVALISHTPSLFILAWYHINIGILYYIVCTFTNLIASCGISNISCVFSTEFHHLPERIFKQVCGKVVHLHKAIKVIVIPIVLD
jgi:hypothetical protein